MMRKRLATAIRVVLLGGCAAVGPDYQAPTGNQWTGGQQWKKLLFQRIQSLQSGESEAPAKFIRLTFPFSVFEKWGALQQPAIILQ